MHYHLEVIMPRTKNIERSLEQIMAPFCEHDEEVRHPFWDWYVIGGRWAGEKETCGYAEERMQEFIKALNDANVTVSSLQMGKQEIKPESQIPLVDTLWNQYFPTENGEQTPCPLFRHSDEELSGGNWMSCDVCLVEEIPEKLSSARVIIAGPSWDHDKTGNIEAHYMISDSIWNGVIHMKTDWNGNVKETLELFKKECAYYKDEWREKITPKPDWLCVTVDYHS